MKASNVIIGLLTVGVVYLGVDNYRIHKAVELQRKVLVSNIKVTLDIDTNFTAFKRTVIRDTFDLSDRVFNLEHQRTHDGMPLFVHPQPPITSDL